MKLFTAVVITALAGIGLGYATAVAEFGIETRIPQFDQPSTRPARAPRAVADELVYDFGTMYMNREGQHIFSIRNEGNAVLDLKEGKKSCKCTTFKVARNTVAPGDSVDVTVGWKTMASWRKTKWRQTANVTTNDPTNPNIALKVEGYLLPEHRFGERQISFSPVTTRDPGEVDVPLFFYTSPDIELVDVAGLPADLKDHLSVDFRPMTDDEIQSHQHEEILKREVKRGYMVTASLKPGLEPRQMPYRSRLSFATEPKLNRPVQLPVEINVRPDVQIFGLRVPYTPDKKILNLGTIPAGKGFQGRVHLVLSGVEGQDIDVKVKEVVPESLEVTFGDAKIERDTTNRRAMFLKLPETVERLSMLGDTEGEMGYVVLETTHPHAPEFRFNVRVAVE